MSDSYKSLVAWQRAMDLVHSIYLATRQFPDSERFALADQMRRSAVSVVSNIAEGYGRFSRNDCRKFLRTSRGSLYELETQILVALRLGYLNKTAANRLMEHHSRAAKPLKGLIQYLDGKSQ